MKPMREIISGVIQAFRKAPPAPARSTGGAAGKYYSRMYSGAKSSRLTTGFGSMQTSADAELVTSLRVLRSRSREVIRDSAFGKRAKVLVQNNVIGTGIGMQAQVKTTRDDLHQRVNPAIEAAWEEWSKAKNCHTGGSLHFSDMERHIMGQVFEAGECFIRKHYRPFGDSTIPYALEVIEPERLLDEFQPSPLYPGDRVRLGVESDEFHRPVAYWIRTVYPGDVRLDAWAVDRIERVPAEQIIHLRIIDRWPQTRGVPWLHATMRNIYDADGYVEAEIIRARDQANVSRALKTDRAYGDETKAADGTITREISSEAGMTEVLYTDEEMQYPPPSSPNSSADPFLRFLLRQFSAGTGPSYESISRDYSQSNYSSSKLSLLDDRDLWRVFQVWFLREFRTTVHEDFVRAAVLSRTITSISVESFALDPAWYTKVRFKPRGWSWVDPTREVAAYKEAVMAGFTTLTDVIAQTANGRDIEDILEERNQELELAKSYSLKFDTDPEFIKAAPAPVQPASNGNGTQKDDDEQDDEEGKQTAEDKKPNNNGRTQVRK